MALVERLAVLVHLERRVAVCVQDFPQGGKADMRAHRIKLPEKLTHVHRLRLVGVEKIEDQENHPAFFGADRLPSLVAVGVVEEGDWVDPGNCADESLGEIRVLLAERLQPVELFAKGSVRREVECFADWLDEFGPSVLNLLHLRFPFQLSSW